ncbi:MAG: hypothetical protein ABIP78_03105, partial [Pyrinomonadaceae bacterium]
MEGIPPLDLFAYFPSKEFDLVECKIMRVINGKYILFGFLMTILVGFFGLTTAQAQTTPTSFSGDATGVIANANVLGTVTTNVRVAQTGALPATGGSLVGDVANANIQLGALGTLSSLTTGVIQT